MEMIKAFLRVLGAAILYLIMYIPSPIIVPLNYFIRDRVRSKGLKFLWYYLNDTKQDPEWKDIDWGDFGRFKHNFWGYIKQNLFRNFIWNLKLSMLFKKPVTNIKQAIKDIEDSMTDTKGNLKMIDILYNYYEGFTWGTYRLNNKLYFRTSGLIEIYGIYFHFQLGTTYRYKYTAKTNLFSVLKERIKDLYLRLR